MFHATRTYLISGAIAHSGICKQRTPFYFRGSLLFPLRAESANEGQCSLWKNVRVWKWKYERGREKTSGKIRGIWIFSKALGFFFFGGEGKFLVGRESERWWELSIHNRDSSSHPCWIIVFNIERILFGRVSFFFLNQKLVFANFKKIKIFST